jgi:hypothetical protein
MIENRKSKISAMKAPLLTDIPRTVCGPWSVVRGLFRLHPKLLKHKLRNINLG